MRLPSIDWTGNGATLSALALAVSASGNRVKGDELHQKTGVRAPLGALCWVILGLLMTLGPAIMPGWMLVGTCGVLAVPHALFAQRTPWPKALSCLFAAPISFHLVSPVECSLLLIPASAAIFALLEVGLHTQALVRGRHLDGKLVQHEALTTPEGSPACVGAEVFG